MVLGDGEAKGTEKSRLLQVIQEGSVRDNLMSSAPQETEKLKRLQIRVMTMDISAAGGMIIIPSEGLKITTRMDLI